MKKRKSPIAKNLMKNSVAGMFSAIEIHNKPAIEYRYEMVVLLLLNSWELLLKAYLYKFHKDVKLFHKDGTTKQFENCLNLVSMKLQNNFSSQAENLNVLYNYRNQVAHFYIEEIDPILFSLVSKSIIFYAKFLKEHFGLDLSEQSNLILLPVGFKRPISPIDYISNTSISEKASNEVKEFLQSIIDATGRLNDKNIEEAIFVDFKMNLTNVSRIKNADLIAGIDNSKTQKLLITTKKDNVVRVTNGDGEKIHLSRNKEIADGIVYYEELQDGIFNEINNIVDANRLLAKDKAKFILGKELYYRIYSERQHVTFNIETYEVLAKAAMLNLYTPFLYWLTKLPPKNIADILLEVKSQSKNPNIQNVVKIVFLLGEEAIKLFDVHWKILYCNDLQKPSFYYTFMEIKKSKEPNPILRVLKATKGKVLLQKHTYGDFINDNNLAKTTLSLESLNMFDGKSKKQNLMKDLDYLAYGNILINNDQIITELKEGFKINANDLQNDSRTL